MNSLKFEWYDIPELFRFVSHRFDVQKAKKIIRETPRNVEDCDITGIWNLVSEIKSDNNGRKIKITVNHKKVLSEEISLNFPIILIPFKDSYLPIDGWHRIAKAKLNNQTVLPCVVLSQLEKEKITI